MHDFELLLISDLLIFSNQFKLIADVDKNVCTYFCPPNCR